MEDVVQVLVVVHQVVVAILLVGVVLPKPFAIIVRDVSHCMVHVPVNADQVMEVAQLVNVVVNTVGVVKLKDIVLLPMDANLIMVDAYYQIQI